MSTASRRKVHIVPRRSHLVVGLLAAMILTVSGCTVPAFAPNGSDATPEAGPATGGGTGSTTVPNAGTADWTPCPEVPQALNGRGAQNMSYDCAKVSVPKDWNAPKTGQNYAVAMIRIRSKSQHNRIGSLLINPGGPGGSGIEIAVNLSYGQVLGGLPSEITDRFDLIGFDPRGVGRSDPVRCISAGDQDASFAAVPDPATQAQFDRLVAQNKKVANGCGAKYGAELANFSTEQAARDMDAIRTAVGDDKMSYLGFSYGTLLGATYAELFPKNVRAMVLDGAIDPKQSFVDGAETQAKGFERAFTNFTAWCRVTPAKCPIGPDARTAVTTAIAQGDTSPVKNDDGRLATSGWIFLAVISSLYTESSWTVLAGSINSLRQGNAKGIFSLADRYAERATDGTYTNLFDANQAVNCADTTAKPSIAQVRKLQGDWRKKYPLFGAPLAVGLLSCTFWPGKRDPYPAEAAVGAPPIVVVGTTGDPATPYENTADLAKLLGVGHVLTWEGEGHTAYPSTPCIVNAVDGYLINLTVPQEGLRCPLK